MQRTSTQQDHSHWDKTKSATALKGAAAILKKWGCSYAVGQEVLRVSHSIYSQAVTGKLEQVKLDRDQLTRAALIASIHSSLRRIFSNNENVYDFMGMTNHNSFFNGHSPLSLISNGDFIALANVHSHIDGLKGAGW